MNTSDIRELLLRSKGSEEENDRFNAGAANYDSDFVRDTVRLFESLTREESEEFLTQFRIRHESNDSGINSGIPRFSRRDSGSNWVGSNRGESYDDLLRFVVATAACFNEGEDSRVFVFTKEAEV